MFSNSDKKKYDDIMDAVESFGEKIGKKINRSGSWVIKGIVMSLSIIFIGGIILVGAILKKSIGSKG